MITRYVITDIDGNGYWTTDYRRFKSFIFADQFESEEKALEVAQKENVGVFKITKIYDTK